MATLTLTAKGQVTLKKEVLQHLGVRPGDKIYVDLLVLQTHEEDFHRAGDRPPLNSNDLEFAARQEIDIDL
ncbi:AbrB/MazE/SpoVT family DNA-binding domain-containing protein, partial [Rhizobium johnstonii]